MKNEEWKEYKLGEVCCKIGSGATPSGGKEAYKGGDYNLIRSQNVLDFCFSADGLAQINEEQAQKLNNVELQENDVLINITGDSVARACVVPNRVLPGRVNQHVAIMRARAEKLNYRYLLYFLQQQKKQLLTLASGGATRNALTKQMLEDYPINLPPLAIQEKTANILSALDYKIELNNAINRNLEEQAQAIFNSAYDDSKKVVPFTSLISIGSGGTPQTSEPSFWNGTIPFFTPKDVGTPYTLVTEKSITDEGLNNCNSKLYPENTTFITARGTVGKLSLAAVPMAMNQSCFALINKEMNPFMIYLYAVRAIKGLKKKSNGAVFDAITIKDFETEFVNEISNDKTRALIEAIEPMFNQIRLNIIENNRLADLRDSLLPKLMTGEIDMAKVKI